MTSNNHARNTHRSCDTRPSHNNHRTHNKYRNHNSHRNRNNHLNHKNNTSTTNDRDTHHVNVNEQTESHHHHRVRSPSISSSESSSEDWIYAEGSTPELIEDQRLSRLSKILFIKLEEGETYRRFAWRIAREVEICRIKDDDTFALTAMKCALPYYTRNTMNLALWIKKNEKTTFTSIKDFIEILSDMEGPSPIPAPVYNKCRCKEQQQAQKPFWRKANCSNKPQK